MIKSSHTTAVYQSVSDHLQIKLFLRFEYSISLVHSIEIHYKYNMRIHIVTVHNWEMISEYKMLEIYLCDTLNHIGI